MPFILRGAFGLIIVAALLQGFTAQPARTFPSETEIRRILAERVDKYRQNVGIVVGLVGPQGRRVVAYGRRAAADSSPVNGDTVFEIGSITKVFTALVLADMAEHREVALSDPVAKYLPREVRIPEANGEEITLRDLATHISGLPRMPTNVESGDPANPYADYSFSRLYEFLNGYRLEREIGARFEYSNLGSALLGHALAQRAGVNYEALVRTRITQPLGMKRTRIVLTPEMRTNFAVGHAYGLEPTSNWDLGALEAAAALRSTANDLLTFLQANLGYTKTTLAPAMATITQVRRTVGNRSIAMGWFVERQEGIDIVSHSGKTGGYLSYIGYDPKARAGVVVLSNSGTGAGVDDIGIHLLNPKAPLLDGAALAPPKQRTEIAIDPSLLDAYAGRYQFPADQRAEVKREGGHLILQVEGEAKLAFYPESDRSFFAKLLDEQLTFNTDARGHVTNIVFHGSGSEVRVNRLD